MIKEALTRLPLHVKDPDPDIFFSSNFACIDFETTTLDKGSYQNPDNRIVSVSIYDNNTKTCRAEICTEITASEVLGDLSRFDFWVAHNAAFEWGWLERCGYGLGETLSACTQLAEYTIAGNRPFGMYASLDDCLRRRGMATKTAPVSRIIKGGGSPEQIPERYLLRYNAQDVLVTARLFARQLEEMQQLELLPVYYGKNLYTPVLVDIANHGIHLDADRVREVVKAQRETLAELDREWGELTGGVNLKSGKQKAELFYDTLGFDVPRGAYTPKGAPKTDATTLGRLKPKDDKQQRILTIVKEATRIRDNLSKILEKMEQCVEEDGGDLQFRINQTATRTHRLSSTGLKYSIQGQNMHRDFKPLICPHNAGWKMAEIDQDGLEFRKAGHLGRDEHAKEDILGGVDPHERTGKIIYKKEWNFNQSAKSKENYPFRQKAKAHTFKPLYGGMKGSKEEMEYYNAFKERYSGIAAAQQRWVDEVILKGYLVTETGLRFYWPGTYRYKDGGATNFQAICNYPVQYQATGDSGVVSIAVVYQWHLLRVLQLQSFICNTIHDSSIGEVHPDELDIYKEIAEYAFTEAVYRYFKDVYDISFFIPLSATVEYNDHWADSEEWRTKWLT